jgi:hypothetical protein
MKQLSDFLALISLPGAIFTVWGVLSSVGYCNAAFSIELFVLLAATSLLGIVTGAKSGNRAAWTVSLISVIALASAVILLQILPIGKPSGNVSGTLGDLQNFRSGQQTYASANGGHYEGDLQCLSEPTLCLQNYPADAPPFLDSDLARQGPRLGHIRYFCPGEPVNLEPNQSTNISPTSVHSFALVATPVSKAVGNRSFCIDSTGNFCFTSRGRLPKVRKGQCYDCEPL